LLVRDKDMDEEVAIGFLFLIPDDEDGFSFTIDKDLSFFSCTNTASVDGLSSCNRGITAITVIKSLATLQIISMNSYYKITNFKGT
jgi:hypothetical protein